MNNQNQLEDLQFGIPASDDKTPIFSGAESQQQNSQKKPWNPQPEPGSEIITDKNGNGFQHQAIICYEKRQTIENSGQQYQKANRKIKKQSKISRDRARWGAQGVRDSSDPASFIDKNEGRSKTNDGRIIQGFTSQNSNYGTLGHPQANPQALGLNAQQSAPTHNLYNSNKKPAHNPNIQINNPISIYHVYFTQQSQRASQDLYKKLEPFEKQYLKQQRKMMQAQGISNAGGRYGNANTIDYNEMDEGRHFQEQAENGSVATQSNEGTVTNSNIYGVEEGQVFSSQNLDSRGRSLPPLRAQMQLYNQHEVKKHELLQTSLVKNIKKRNKYNASLRTSNQNAKDAVQNIFSKSNSQSIYNKNRVKDSSSFGANTPGQVYRIQNQTTGPDFSSKQFVNGGGETRNAQINQINPLSTDPTVLSSGVANMDDISSIQIQTNPHSGVNTKTNRQKGQLVNQSYQQSQANRYQLGSPYQKKYNDQYYIHQIAKKQQIRQSSQIPNRDNLHQFYTIDPNENNTGGWLQNNQKSSQQSKDNNGSLDNVRVSIENPFANKNKNSSQVSKPQKPGQEQRRGDIRQSQSRSGPRRTQKKKSDINNRDQSQGLIKIHDDQRQQENDEVLMGDTSRGAISKTSNITEKQQLAQIQNMKQCFLNFKNKMENAGNLKPTNQEKQIQSLQEQLMQMKELLLEKDKEIDRLKTQKK